MLLKINVLMLEKIAVNFYCCQFIIKFYFNFITNIIINSKLNLMKKAFKIVSKTVILFKSAILISIFNILKKSQSQSDKNYIFVLKKQLKLRFILLLIIMYTNT